MENGNEILSREEKTFSHIFRMKGSIRSEKGEKKFRVVIKKFKFQPNLLT